MTIRPPARSIIIVGGGTAGWMAAALLARWAIPKGLRVTVVEAPGLPPIGVGEATTPLLTGFMRALRIPDSVWMAQCQATFKLGIRFEGWSGPGTSSSWFHPFWTGQEGRLVSDLEAWRRQRPADSPVLVQDHLLTTHFAKTHRAVYSGYETDARALPGVGFGYHMDAALFAQMLRRLAVKLGVRHLRARVSDVRVDGGAISGIETKEEGFLQADFFIDCSGPKSILARQALGIDHASLGDRLFCDRACVIQCPRVGEEVPTYSTARAMRSGWRWHIPLRDRDSFGYVYSSRHCPEEDAVQELRESLGPSASMLPVRTLSFGCGYLRQPWTANCLALGFAAGFVEPLEATAIGITQVNLGRFLQWWPRVQESPEIREIYNTSFDGLHQSVADFIACHYCITGRLDTPFWRDYQAISLSPTLVEELRRWKTEGKCPVSSGSSFLRLSWMSVLDGMDSTNHLPTERPDPELENRLTMVREGLVQEVDRLATEYPTHHSYLQAIRHGTIPLWG